MQKVSDAPLKKCPHCGKSQLQRLMSAPVFRLKGGGWYETDFKGDKDNQRNLADRPEADAPKDLPKDARQGRQAKDGKGTGRGRQGLGRQGGSRRGQGQAGRQTGGEGLARRRAKKPDSARQAARARHAPRTANQLRKDRSSDRCTRQSVGSTADGLARARLKP